MTWQQDGRQVDMFAMFAPDPAPQESDGDQLEAEDERRARHDAEMAAWQLERTRAAKCVAAARAAGRVRVIEWGNKAARGKPYWRVEILEHEGEAFSGGHDYEMHNCGGGGPYGKIEGATNLAEGALHMFRQKIREAAREVCDDTRQKQYAQLVAWIVEQNPPLLTGADLAQEYEQLRAIALESNRLRCLAIHAGARDYINAEGQERSIYSL